MTTKPRALDLFCGEGGASMGLHRAGFEVVGVDIKPQSRYPFTFRLANALNVSVEMMRGFDLLWASPPCQSYSAAMKHLAMPQPMLIDPIRKLFMKAAAIGNLPWIIENVVGAPLNNPMILCGTMFGLRVHRHRLFEGNLLFALVPECFAKEPVLNPHRAESRQRIYAEFGRQDPEKLWRNEMGVEWMSRHGTREAIPPAYSEFIGKQALAFIESQKSVLSIVRSGTDED